MRMWCVDGEGTGVEVWRRMRKPLYRDVQPEYYGLEDEDILEMGDKTLNSLVSLKKLATYREDDSKVYRANVRKKWMKKQKLQAKKISAAPVAVPEADRLKSYGLIE